MGFNTFGGDDDFADDDFVYQGLPQLVQGFPQLTNLYASFSLIEELEDVGIGELVRFAPNLTRLNLRGNRRIHCDSNDINLITQNNNLTYLQTNTCEITYWAIEYITHKFANIVDSLSVVATDVTPMEDEPWPEDVQDRRDDIIDAFEAFYQNLANSATVNISLFSLLLVFARIANA